MRIAIIHNGVVENIIEAEPSSGYDPRIDPGGGREKRLAVATDAAGPGWFYDGEAFHAPAEPPPPVPASVRTFQAREALAQTPGPDAPGSSPGGTLLAAVESFVEERRASHPSLANAWDWIDPWERDGMFVQAFAQKFGLDDAALDDFFRRAAAIAS